MSARDWLAAATWRAMLYRPSRATAWASVGILGANSAGCYALMSESEGPRVNPLLIRQEDQGWDVDSGGRPLLFPGAQDQSADGSTDWRDALATASERFAPAGPRWLPFYGPTLFQSLQAPRNDDLRAVVRPVYAPSMAVAFQRGRALLSLFTDAAGNCRNDTALVLDLDGPDAVALAAALAPCFDPVFFFDNWPHPLGVVPAHLTLGAALYYLPIFEQSRARRAAGAGPVFVLDRQRTNHYVDSAGEFDNRYSARLPPPAALAAAGIQRVIYVTPDERITVEADDLNDDLVGMDQTGIPVRMLAMSDFQPGDPDPTTPLASAQPSGPPAPGPTFYFGGSPSAHRCFWSWYGWAPASSSPAPPRLWSRCHFRPVARATGFSGSSRWSSHARSGSLGRFHFGFVS